MPSRAAAWLRVIIDLALQAFESTPAPKQPEGAPKDAPVLLLMDEFPVLGHMAKIEAAAGQIAGFDVKLWTIIQDVTQLQRLYKDSWQTFIGNAGVVMAFANTDSETLKVLSQKLGRNRH